MKLTAVAILIALFVFVAPLRAEVRYLDLSARQDKSNVVVSWRTAAELQNLGFNVYRQTPGGAREKVNAHLIAGMTLQHAGTPTDAQYRWHDVFAGGGFVQYWLEDVDLHGVRTLHGPITPALTSGTVTGGNSDTIADLGSVGGIFEPPDGIGAPVYASAAPTKQQISQQYDLASEPAVKLFVTTEGWTRVRKSDIQAAGFDPGSDPKALSLFADGIEIPILVDDGGDGRFDANDTIAFYGTGIDTPSTGAHAYWLVADKGKRARIDTGRAATATTAAAPPNFPYVYQRIERLLFDPSLTNNGDRENFFGQLVSDWWPVSEDVNARGLDTAASGTAALDLAIQGGSDGPHIVIIEWNGAQIGTATFDSQQRWASTIQIPIASVIAGTNTLTLTAAGGDDDFSAVESLRLTYPHRFVADRDALKCAAPGGAALTIDGFTLASVTVLDVTDLLHPAFVPAAVRPSGGGFSASLAVPGSGNRTLLAFADDRTLAPAQIAPSLASSWHDAKNAAQLVIIANRALIDAAAPLARARNAQGIATVIIDVQDIYDEFGFGHRGPAPLRDFFLATRSWKTPPRYAILLGDASFDPRNYLGLGAFDLVPTMLVPTEYLKTACDDCLADFTGSGVPALAIGRLPARTAADANVMIGKILNRTIASNVQLISDGWDDDFSFGGEVDAVVPSIPSSLSIEKLDLTNVADPRAAAVAMLNRGALLVDYAGHGTENSWGPDIVMNDDVASLTNRAQPFLVGMDCLNGYFQDMYATSFAETLMLNPNGGAVAVWTSSSLTFPQPQSLMNRELMRQLFGGAPAIGDAIVKAKAATYDLDVRRTWILFGDPSMRLK